MSDDFQLPPLPPLRSLSGRLSRKRARDYDVSSSSDPPTFSSDPPEAIYSGPDQHNSTIENDGKRKYRGPWWGNANAQPRPRGKRQFTRAQDSGVWLGSEESESSIDLGLENTSKITNGQAEALHRVVPNLKVSSRRRIEDDALEDEGAFTEEACECESKTNEQTAQVRIAEAIILDCLESGKENVDLS